MKSYYLIFLAQLIFISAFSQDYQYLGSYTSNGTPNYLESPGDNISTSLLESISLALPETFQVPTYNPHYISSNYDTDTYLTSSSEVFVTFVDEGAGFRNVLGFYTYETESPITSAPSKEDITIVFPNSSKLGSGGGLQAGDKVSIGTFPSGTAIGWVLISNGWTGSQVGNGYWRMHSNPDFNSELDPDKRHHNVLINDSSNELIILGFEDIDREMTWCDQDFNDAIFYITASSYSDMNTTNNVAVESATDVYSSNLAGFESNGDLADMMAKRSINRLKNKNQYRSHKGVQEQYYKSNYSTGSLGNYFPDTGMGANEVPHVATSFDLINYANAEDVFSVDYYLENKRVSAALVTKTSNRIYDHTKSICDRLNGSILLDTRPVRINNHEIIFAIIEKPSGELEYAVSFSILLGDLENKLYSYWNIAAYPEGDFKNFQVWGNSMGQLAHITNNIINELENEKPLTSLEGINRVPDVFVSSAYYRNKELHMKIINKAGVHAINIDGNLKNTEQLETNHIEKQVELSGEFNQDIVVDTGFLFDIGLSVSYNGANIFDTLYLADGPWGIDYDVAEETSIDQFEILPQVDDLSDLGYQLERSVDVSGIAHGTINVFKNILAGDLALRLEDYDKVSFKMISTTAIEISLVQEGLLDWNDRLKYIIPSTDGEEKNTVLPINIFKNSSGNHVTIEKLKTIVFSIRGNYSEHTNFSFTLKDLILNSAKVDSIITDIYTNTDVINYPNPFYNSTTLKFPEKSKHINLIVYDLLGRVVFNETIKTNDDEKTVLIKVNNIAKGVYKYKALTENNKSYNGTFMIK